MRIIVLRTLQEQMQGLQHVKPIPDNTILVFPGIAAGAVFHSRNVREPFDIAFLDKTYSVLKKETVTPEAGTATAPPGTAHVIEARAGLFSCPGVVA